MKMGPVLTSFEDTYCTPIEINKFGAKPGVVPPPKTAGKPKSRLPPIPARARSSSGKDNLNSCESLVGRGGRRFRRKYFI